MIADCVLCFSCEGLQRNCSQFCLGIVNCLTSVIVQACRDDVTDSNVMYVQEIVVALPELLGPIQAQLLDLVSVVLAGRPLRDNLPPPLLQALHQAVQYGKFPAISV